MLFSAVFVPSVPLLYVSISVHVHGIPIVSNVAISLKISSIIPAFEVEMFKGLQKACAKEPRKSLVALD